MTSGANRLKKKLDESEGLSRAMKFCAYQERCLSEMQQALHKWNVEERYQETILDHLVENDYINERRYTKSFIQGKFKNNKWGKQKIIYELRSKGIDSGMIMEGIGKMDEDEYIRVATKLINQKIKEYDQNSPFHIRRKLMWYMVGKGYEREVITDLFKEYKILKLD